MNLSQINPTKQQLKHVMTLPKDRPIVMCNIIKFKKQIKATGESGQEAYGRYLKNAAPLIEKAEARIIWKGKVEATVIGDNKDEPDIIFLVEYPSTSHFIKMISSEAYQKITHDRSLALDYGGLLACKPY